MAQPKGNAYAKPVTIMHVWEQIVAQGENKNYLISPDVSEYIRSLEDKIKKYEKI